ncbi:hypothetical protein E5676_scaffold1193G00350 [Cucumis melo var. makuwa]|uniref:Ty3-gypsy retrotransposon protein n=1 Tax=Cucumis melo var. makuwa TaxID=1194695 RepID=A0A5A7UUG5_CUCMM|nr:hypothetical protein E6C27_scaffold518G00450 [Cucumis melo var. makuwa]TYK14115.1 hypothetical protein E5676_scaffold1193G00350 [Cucumis melo var. makuwa]
MVILRDTHMVAASPPSPCEPLRRRRSRSVQASAVVIVVVSINRPSPSHSLHSRRTPSSSRPPEFFRQLPPQQSAASPAAQSATPSHVERRSSKSAKPSRIMPPQPESHTHTQPEQSRLSFDPVFDQRPFSVSRSRAAPMPAEPFSTREPSQFLLFSRADSPVFEPSAYSGPLHLVWITTYLGLRSPMGSRVWHGYRYGSSDLTGSSQPDCLSVSSGYATDQFVLGVPLGHQRPDFVPTGRGKGKGKLASDQK